eukprot:scaffold510_cov155-Amphora_coffeaeformis.AAC.3
MSFGRPKLINYSVLQLPDKLSVGSPRLAPTPNGCLSKHCRRQVCLAAQNLEKSVFVARSFDGGKVGIVVHHGSIVRGRGMNVEDTDLTPF